MKLTYDEVVSICDAHGICLPVDCVEMVVEIANHALAKPDHSGDGEKAPCELCKGVGAIGMPGQRCFACNGSGESKFHQAAAVPQDGGDEREAFAAAWHIAFNVWTKSSRHATKEEADKAAVSAMQAALAQKAVPIAVKDPNAPTATVYVECCECSECGHIGINDAHDTDSSCGYSCGWTGPSPVEDKCPGCGRENVMGSACPKCSGRYRFLADGGFSVPPAPIASSLSDRDIQEAALEWQCDPAFDHFVLHEDELVEYVRKILALTHPAAAQPSGAEVLEEHRPYLFGNYGALLDAENAARRRGEDSTAEGLKALAYALCALERASVEDKP